MSGRRVSGAFCYLDYTDLNHEQDYYCSKIVGCTNPRHIMSEDKTVRKLLKYMRKDRFKKLKSYVEKHDIILRNIQLIDRDNLLHEACRQEKGYLVR